MHDHVYILSVLLGLRRNGLATGQVEQLAFKAVKLYELGGDCVAYRQACAAFVAAVNHLTMQHSRPGA